MVNESNQLTINPNPARNQAMILFEAPTDINIIQVFDLSGRLVKEIQGDRIDKSGKAINISDLPGGMHIIQAVDREGNKFQKKLMVQH